MSKRDPVEVGNEVTRAWVARARSTAPVDRKATEAAIRKFTGKEPIFQWAKSPLDGLAQAAELTRSAHKPLASEILSKIEKAEMDANGRFSDFELRQKVTHLLGAGLMKKCPASTKIEATEMSLRVNALEDKERRLFGATLDAALDVSPLLLAYLDFMRLAYGDKTKVDALVDVPMVGWFWFFPTVVVISERPIKMALDSAGHLHREDGPAVEYADGFTVCAHHNVWVPEDQVLGNKADWRDIEAVDEEIQKAVVGSKIGKWSKDTAKTEEAKVERDEAAEAVLLLGGVSGVRALIDSGE